MNNAFLIGATGSGCGKTTITCALLKAIKDRGLIPEAFKCGPDYIDPMFHKTILGIESKNIDLFFSDENEARELFYRDNDSDVAVVEGVMGLYDGMSFESNDGSSYDIACELDIPIILVVNARGMGRSLLALIKGFQVMDEEKRIQGIILNQASEMMCESLGKLIEKELGITVLGYFPKNDTINLESRYLGLKLPGEIESLENNIELAAGIISKTVDIEKLLEISKVKQVNDKIYGCQKEGLYSKKGKDIAAICNQCDNEIRIGIARDDAFCFYYEENLKLLNRLGAELVFFSPLKDKKLPEEIDGLVLGGGYPELFASQLSANTEMRESIRNAINSGLPSLAECGGFMYLHEAISVENIEYPMVGCIDGKCEKQNKLVRFGYVSISEKEARFLTEGNRCIKGHEFHYYDSNNNGTDGIATKPSGRRSWDAGHISGNHWWGFAHLYYPSNIKFAMAFVDKCREHRRANKI